MNNKPKISIVIPTYSSSLFIRRTINSVLNQTFKDWELLIVDDCSMDNTVEIVNDFIKADSRIKLFKTPTNSGGPALPKNIGIKNAQGEYIAFLDHDDEWLPEKIEKQLAVFENSKDENLGVVSCHVNVKDNNTNKTILRYNNFYSGNIIDKIAKECFIFSSSCVLLKKATLVDVGLFDVGLKSADDWDMWIRISEKGYFFSFVPEHLLNYFVHANNVCYRKGSQKAKRDFCLVCQKHKALLLKYSLYNIGYSNFLNQKYNQSRKYFMSTIFFKNSSSREKAKSFGYLLISYCPKIEPAFKNIWNFYKKIWK